MAQQIPFILLYPDMTRNANFLLKCYMQFDGTNWAGEVGRI